MNRPDILFLVLDSVRPDRVSTYGHGRPTTPTLDQLAERATVFENAYAPAPWTLPSHCSMFTGLSPSEHGITNGFTDRSLVLPPSIETLTEGLSEAGYRTAGFSNNPWVGKLSGLTRGFEEFVEWDLEVSKHSEEPIHDTVDLALSKGHSLLGHVSRQPIFLLKRRFFTSRLVERAGKWLDNVVASSEPSFTFLNLMEAHSPYFPPESSFRELELQPPNSIEPRILNTKLLAFVLGKRDLSAELQERVMEYYDASLRYQDRKVAELLSVLQSHGALDDTLVVICSDHGKNLGEYDRSATPPHSLRDVNTDTLLLTKMPGQSQGRHISDPVELARLYEILTNDSLVPREALVSEEYALTEDFIPHTGKRSTPVDRWRMLSNGTDRFMRNDSGDEYLFRDGSPIDDVTRRDEMRKGLIDRVNGLSTVGDRTDAAGEIDRNVEAQLADLGYLE
ncbi:MAG: sulfatase [Natronomonas sp.]